MHEEQTLEEVIVRPRPLLTNLHKCRALRLLLIDVYS